MGVPDVLAVEGRGVGAGDALVVGRGPKMPPNMPLAGDGDGVTLADTVAAFSFLPRFGEADAVATGEADGEVAPVELLALRARFAGEASGEAVSVGVAVASTVFCERCFAGDAEGEAVGVGD